MYSERTIKIYKSICIVLLGLIGIVLSLPAAAVDLLVDLELALGVDVSGSIDGEEALQNASH